MNSRKSARQVPSTLTRFLKSQTFLKSPPAAYYPLLSHPPSAALIKQLPPRPSSDLPPTLSPTLPPSPPTTRRRPRTAGLSNGRKPLPIVFGDDEIRKQFFRDHPFEAYRPVFLVESGEIEKPTGPQGREWTTLSQRSKVPSAEDAIAFTHHLHTIHSVPLTLAYTHSLSQFRTLRSEHETSTRSAFLQASSFTPASSFFGHIKKGILVEERVLEGWNDAKNVQDAILEDRKQTGGTAGNQAKVAAAGAGGAGREALFPVGEVEGGRLMPVHEGDGERDVFSGGVEYQNKFGRRWLGVTEEEEEDKEDEEVEEVGEKKGEQEKEVVHQTAM